MQDEATLTGDASKMVLGVYSASKYRASLLAPPELITERNLVGPSRTETGTTEDHVS